MRSARRVHPVTMGGAIAEPTPFCTGATDKTVYLHLVAAPEGPWYWSGKLG
jgi:hypothetical protein